MRKTANSYAVGVVSYFWGVKGRVLSKLTIKHIKELPNWFNLEKYDAAETLDATGWYEQLSARSNLKSYVDRDIHDSPPSSLQTLEVLEALRTTPIIDVKSNLRVNVLLAGGRLEELRSGSPRYSLGVHMTTVREHYLTEGNIEDKKRTYARNFFAQIFGKDWLTKPLKYTCKDWIDEPIDFIQSRGRLNINLTVDVSLPDNVLIEQFKLFLCEMRSPLKKAGISIDNKLRPDFAGWVKFGILPYLDLNMWAEIERVKISNRVMADAIFPVGDGGEEVVRKTTQKLADEILTESHLNKLAALAAYEIAERNTD